MRSKKLIVSIKCAAVISIAAAFIAFMLASGANGHDDAFRISEKEESEHWEKFHADSPEIRFSISGPTTYEYLAVAYERIGILFLMTTFSFGLLTSKYRVSIVLSPFLFVAAATGTAFFLHKRIHENNLVEEYLWEVPRNTFAKTTIAYDWILVSAEAFLVIAYILLAANILRQLNSQNE